VNEPSVVTPGQRAGERVVAHVDSSTARWAVGLTLVCATCWLIIDYEHAGWHTGGRLAWSMTILGAVALVARGVFLGRPVTAQHATAAVTVAVTGMGAHLLSLGPLGNALIVGSGLVLMWPTSAHPEPADLPRVWTLVNATRADPLAPFAMQTLKCHHFSADGTAALAYRTRIGYAVVSGDPVGDERRFPELVADFAALCRARGWRIAVLGCGERRLGLWSDPGVLGQSLRPVPIGRDVVIDVGSFAMVGRKFRNLRQAVQRTHNCGVTTEVVAEQDMPAELLVELTEVLLSARRGARTERGFSMALDGTLEGRYPGVQLMIARDASGLAQGFHRYAVAGGGTDVSLDVPWRRRGAPNGIDERLTVDMLGIARQAGAQRLSLAFAAFPELFDDKHRGQLAGFFYWAVHLLDPLIALESLYRYLCKFHAAGDQRYALVSLRQLVPLLYVLLSLEFMPRRRRH
jgi:lysylphosphatidylglycerol synthetase-like protein (DUF2156 family)